ncbi:MAG: hypothetical protein GX768_08720 [Chloroflexi bacterium]|jgi:hypothetical protein|nr:hypothetical protein [Chloroflexota bacterium]
MTDEPTEQKRQKIIERFDREQRIYEKSYEDAANLLNKSLETKNLAGIDLARKNMGEASEILGDLVRQKNEMLSDLQTAENAAQTDKDESLSQDTPQTTLENQEEKQEKSEEEGYNYGYGM